MKYLSTEHPTEGFDIVVSYDEDLKIIDVVDDEGQSVKLTIEDKKHIESELLTDDLGNPIMGAENYHVMPNPQTGEDMTVLYDECFKILGLTETEDGKLVELSEEQTADVQKELDSLNN